MNGDSYIGLLEGAAAAKVKVSNGTRRSWATASIDWNHRTAAGLRKVAGGVSVDLWSQAGLVLLWGVSLGVVGAWDEFPINDDWAYSLPILALNETGRFQLSHWQSMPLAPQLAWGWLAVQLLGASPFALRASTQVLALVAVLCLYRLIRSRGSSSAIAFVGATTLLSNPLFVACSNTFMTDVPFVALLLLSLLWFIRAATDSSALNVGMAFSFALLATLVRQLGVAVAIAFCVVTIAQWGLGKRWLLRAAAPTLIVLGSLPAFRQLLEMTVGVPALYDEKNLGLTRAMIDLFNLRLGVLRGPLQRGWMSLGVLGLCLLPLTVLVIASAPPTRLRTAGAIALTSVCSVGLFLVVRVLLPELHDPGSLLVGASMGPMTLPGPPHAGTPYWLEQVLGSVAAAGAGLLLLSKGCVLQGRVNALRRLADPAWSLPMLTLLLALAPLLIAYGPYFDRYLLFAVPLWIVACVGAETVLPKGALIGALALVSILLVFSTAATRDLFAWNRVRWHVANAFVSATPREQLDAGFEFNNFAENLAELELHKRLALTTVSRTSAPFAIQFRAAEGEHVVDRFTVDAWLPTSPRQLVLVTRK